MISKVCSNISSARAISSVSAEGYLNRESSSSTPCVLPLSNNSLLVMLIAFCTLSVAAEIASLTNLSPGLITAAENNESYFLTIFYVVKGQNRKGVRLT